MWLEVVTPVAVPLFAAAATVVAGRFLGHPAVRRVTLARSEAELHNLLPDGPAKAALREKVEVDVLTHVKLEKDRRFRRLVKVVIALLVVLGAASVASIGVAVYSLANDDGRWVNLAMPILIATVIGVIVVLKVVIDRADRIRDEATDEAEDESSSSSSSS